ncbi:MAG: hypothetical protein HS113_20645 [Verrucomicrobiales bacterium]|nr:hypothetical protein [Verrucomicrobiales bacterium]
MKSNLTPHRHEAANGTRGDCAGSEPTEERASVWSALSSSSAFRTTVPALRKAALKRDALHTLRGSRRALWLALCLALIGGLGGFTTATADEVVWREDFETDFALDDWSASDGVWQIGIPTSGPRGAHGGERVGATILAGDYPASQVTRLYCRPLELPAVEPGESLQLRYWEWYSYSSYDNGKAQVSLWDAAAAQWTAWTNLHTVAHVSQGWTPAQGDLTAYAGQRIRLGFLHTAARDSVGRASESSGWYLDDLEIWRGVPVYRNPEDFESGLGDWIITQGIWQLGVTCPKVGPGNAWSGQAVAATALCGNYDGYQDSRLVSPVVQLPRPPDVSMLQLRFWHWWSYGALDSGKVQLSAYDPAADLWGAWQDLKVISGTSGVWSRQSIELGPFAGRTVRLGFLHVAERDSVGRASESSGWYIDDVRIESGCVSVPRQLERKEAEVVSVRADACREGLRFGLGPGAPEGATIDPILGVFTWIPTECQGPSTNLITITVTDPDNPTLQPLDYETITVVVLEVNEAPIIGAIPRIGLTAGEPAVFNATQYVFDPDCPAQVLTYSLDQGSPAGAAIDPVSGVLGWEPTPEQAAQNHILYLRVTDELGASATREVSLGPVIPGPRITRVAFEGDSLLLWLDEVTAGQEWTLESAGELRNPPTATAWTPVGSPFVWQANPVRLPGVLTGETPQAFFRLVRSP